MIVVQHFCKLRILAVKSALNKYRRLIAHKCGMGAALGNSCFRRISAVIQIKMRRVVKQHIGIARSAHSAFLAL